MRSGRSRDQDIALTGDVLISVRRRIRVPLSTLFATINFRISRPAGIRNRLFVILLIVSCFVFSCSMFRRSRTIV